MASPSLNDVGSNRFQPRIGEAVQIADAELILSTLDQNGCSDGLPFMPEMVSLCGTPAIVRRWANNVCVQADSTYFGAIKNCVVLDTERCNGASHGGCQMGCVFLWKTDWVGPANTHSGEVDEQATKQLTQLVSNHCVQKDSSNLPLYQCQATQLDHIAQVGRKLDFNRLKTERDLNKVSVTGLVTDLCSSVLARATGRSNGFPGPCEHRTPVRTLDLQPGDQVRVRSKQEIIQTLNGMGMNRGMWFDPIMARYCGQTLSVTRVVQRFIDESTGKLIQTKVPSVVLDDLHCDGRSRHYCGRLLQFFWREIWLERA